MALVFSVVLNCSAADAQSLVHPETNAGQVQKRIPQPGEAVQPLPNLGVPAPVPMAPIAPLRFVLTGVVIEGATALQVDALAPAYEAYLAREIDLSDIQKILDSITAKYRDDGYFLSRAIARPQPLALGILHITVVEGFVRRVIFPDMDSKEEAGLSPYFAAIVGQRPLALAPLERALLLVNDIPGLHIDPKLQPEDEESGAYDLVVRVQRQRFSGFGAFDNRGTESLGPWQLQLSGGINSLLSAFDRLQLSVFDTPNDPTELLSSEILYNAPLDRAGTRLALSVTRTHLLPGGSLASQDENATAMRYASRVTYPLLRSRDQSVWLGGSFEWLDSAERGSGVQLFDDHLRVLRGTVNYVGNDAAGNVNLAELDLSQGLGFLGASKGGDAGLSRANGRADFTKIAGSLSRQQILTQYWGAQLAMGAQKSADPLLISEQFALGGMAFGRGYDPAEIAGDDAVAGSFELRYGRPVKNPVIRSYQLYGFYDIGMIWNIDAENIVPQRQSLASLGFGLRLALQRNIAASIEITKPLTRRVAADHGKPLRVFLNLAAPF